MVVDLDDTISTTTSRDFENAKPITSVIDKINYLYDNGWEIVILTARGQLSCDGDVQKADLKYRGQIEAWLERHKVKYHTLSFNKILAAYYVDDKNLLPEDFVDLDIKVIKNGWSGAIVEKRGHFIYKTHPNANNEAFWYHRAKDIVMTPKVHSLIGETICLEYLPPVIGYSFKLPVAINMIQSMAVVEQESPSFSTYIDRMVNHFSYNGNYWELLDPLKERVEYFDGFKSFCHGDFSLDNILVSHCGEHYCIDPIYDPNCYSSWLLDVSKLMHSLRRYDHKKDYIDLVNEFSKNIDRKSLLLLEITQYIRTLKYIKDVSIKETFKETIKKLIDEFTS